MSKSEERYPWPGEAHRNYQSSRDFEREYLGNWQLTEEEQRVQCEALYLPFAQIIAFEERAAHLHRHTSGLRAYEIIQVLMDQVDQMMREMCRTEDTYRRAKAELIAAREAKKWLEAHPKNSTKDGNEDGKA